MLISLLVSRYKHERSQITYIILNTYEKILSIYPNLSIQNNNIDTICNEYVTISKHNPLHFFLYLSFSSSLNGGTVNISTPSCLIRTVCSNCAARPRSFVTTVQSSFHS
mmetsp:Transcript_7948/g.11881  ORF Transcript_7948/g.11881 Transcript_7948/m.11881 type:complete len:109 (+) Transcript_7948:148-474(+)